MMEQAVEQRGDGRGVAEELPPVLDGMACPFCRAIFERDGEGRVVVVDFTRHWTQRDRAASLRLFRLVAEVLRAIEAGVSHPNPGWQCKDCPFQNRCWAWR